VRHVPNARDAGAVCARSLFGCGFKPRRAFILLIFSGSLRAVAVRKIDRPSVSPCISPRSAGPDLGVNAKLDIQAIFERWLEVR